MNRAYLLPLVLVPSALVYACGGSDNSAIDGGLDATADNTVPGDSAADTSQDTSSDATAEGGKDAAVDVVISVACRKPANCFDGGDPDAAYPPDGGEVCCGTIVTTGTGKCSLVSATTACEAPSSCPTSFVAGCGSDTVRLCSSDPECVETGGGFGDYTQCCTLKFGDASVHLCANSTIAQIAGGTCP